MILRASKCTSVVKFPFDDHLRYLFVSQCARRGVACHYPTESRRGQRKKRVDFINTQSDDISTLLDLYRNATLKDDGLLDMPDDSDSDCDGRDL